MTTSEKDKRAAPAKETARQNCNHEINYSRDPDPVLGWYRLSANAHLKLKQRRRGKRGAK
jgi:hypothetical protein